METTEISYGVVIPGLENVSPFSRSIQRFFVSPCRINLARLPLTACLGGWLICMLVFWKGIGLPHPHTIDQALNGNYTDWYAPMNAASFRFFRYLGEHIGWEDSFQKLFYVCYAGVLWAGLFLVLHSGRSFWRSTASKPRWVVGVVLFATFSVWFQALILSKTQLLDTISLASLLFAAGLLLNMPKRFVPKVVVGLATLFFLYYGTAQRHNLVLTLFPLLCWLAWSMPAEETRRRFPRRTTGTVFLAAVALWGGYLFLNHYVNYTLLKSYRTYVLQERFYGDIFLLNYYSPGSYQNPPNTFDNDFDGLTKELFWSGYDVRELFQGYAFKAIASELRLRGNQSEFSFTQEFVKVLPEEEFNRLEDPRVFFDFGNRTYRLRALNERTVLEQFPKDYVVLRDAWLERVGQNPLVYVKVKLIWWVRMMFLGRLDDNSLMVPPEFYPVRIFFGGLTNGFTMFCVTSLLCLYTFSKRRLEKEVFPFLMLSWSAVFTALPLVIFLPSTLYRYLYWFLAASLIAVALFLANSPLFAEIVQTIQRYLERKAK